MRALRVVPLACGFALLWATASSAQEGLPACESPFKARDPHPYRSFVLQRQERLIFKFTESTDSGNFPTNVRVEQPTSNLALDHGVLPLFTPTSTGTQRVEISWTQIDLGSDPKRCRARQVVGDFPIVAGSPLAFKRLPAGPRKDPVQWRCPPWTASAPLSATIRYELGVGKQPKPLGSRSKTVKLGPIDPCIAGPGVEDFDPRLYQSIKRSPLVTKQKAEDEDGPNPFYYVHAGIFRAALEPLVEGEKDDEDLVTGGLYLNLTPLGRIGKFRQDFMRWSVTLRAGRTTSTQRFCTVLTLIGRGRSRSGNQTVYPGTRCPTTRRKQDSEDTGRGLGHYGSLP